MGGIKVLVACRNHLDGEALRVRLKAWDYETGSASTIEEVWQGIENGSYDLVLIDYSLVEGEAGWAVQRDRSDPYMPWVFLVPRSNLLSALPALRGALDGYLTLPLREEEVSLTVSKAVERGCLFREGVQQDKEEAFPFFSIVAKSQEMAEVLKLANQVAKTDATVLLLGESGTGKELMARAIHGDSLRRKGPFIKVDCAALPEGLLESELFGHEKGAFTDAKAVKPGRFELAHGGTIFLDEVTALSLPLQAKLLRVLQEKEFERVGGTRTLKMDVRFLAATNQDLDVALRERCLREDLYYRLNVFPLYIPPLRRRKEDLPILAQHFLEMFSHKYGKRIVGFSPGVLGLFFRYPWPGNVRELEHCIERAVIMGEGPLLKEDEVSLNYKSEDFISDFLSPEGERSMTLAELEKEYIRKILRDVRGHKSKAARILGINRKTLLEKRRRYGMD